MFIISVHLFIHFYCFPCFLTYVEILTPSLVFHTWLPTALGQTGLRANNAVHRLIFLNFETNAVNEHV